MPTTSHRDTRLTYEDFCRIPDDGMRHEIIDGVHYVTPSPVRRHQQLMGLVVEILSPSTRRRDLGIKRQLFDRGGVREYWVVDPKAHELTVYRRAPGGGLVATEQLSASGDAALTTPLLPGFSLSLTKLFA